jgi:hypothetical protein
VRSQRKHSSSLVWLVVVLMTAAWPPSRSHAQEVAGRGRIEPTSAEIVRALETVKADPNLAPTRKIKSLRWTGQRPSRSGVPSWLRWIAGFARWVDQSARVLVWMGVTVLVSLLAVALIRMIRRRRDAEPAAERMITPTHVQDLDIRPETLPSDVGAAARALWDRGDHRAALALLYRGLLSRLAHVHQMPIRDSSTEGECLDFARHRLPVVRHDYVGRLIGVWQHAVYGHEHADTPTVHALCDGFSAALDAGASEVAS